MPVVIPIDMRSVTVPPVTLSRPTRSSVRCISQQARAGARLVLGPVEEQQQRIAAPLEEARAVVVGVSRRAMKTSFSVSRISSAPILPWRASRSESAVKPEMSTNTIEPSIVAVQLASGLAQPVDHEPRDVRLQDVLARASVEIDRSPSVLTCPLSSIGPPLCDGRWNAVRRRATSRASTLPPWP